MTWTIEGTVSGLSDLEGTLGSLGLVAGAPYTYSLTFDSDTPVCDAGGGAYGFPDAVLATSFSSGAFLVALAPGTTTSMGAFGNNFDAEGPVRLHLIDTVSVIMGPTPPIAPPVHAGTQISLE